jgi:hypothetical protein
MNLKDLEFTAERLANATLFGEGEREALKIARDLIAALRAANDLPADFQAKDLVPLIWEKARLPQAPAAVIHIPSAADPEKGIHAVVPGGLGINAVIGTVIHAAFDANAQDNPPAALRKTLEAIGLTVVPAHTTMPWDRLEIPAGEHATPVATFN